VIAARVVFIQEPIMTGRYGIPLLCLLAASACRVDVDARNAETSTSTTVAPPADTRVEPPPPSSVEPSAFTRAEPAPPARGGCHPSYEPCVPMDSDVDCAGGSGNGPSYVHGPVRIIGPDAYGLDRDGDGVACDG
jgi:hypothetical protein